jgi:hypothetical protein
MRHPLDAFTVEDLQDLATSQRVCCRPVVQKVTDTLTGRVELVPIPCGATQARLCPACAEKARRLRIQQCREGWHRTTEPEPDDQADDLDDGEELADDLDGDDEDDQDAPSSRRVRSTRRREDVPDLPKIPMTDGTIGKAFTTPDGKTYRPSMFLTVTLPSYGRVRNDGTPVDPESYDYHRAALDALHFPRLVDRFWQNLRRCAGYHVQYFACVEAQRRLAPHLHAAVRGVIPRAVVKQVAAATYHQLWWPSVEVPLYNNERLPVWDEYAESYLDPDTGALLPTWEDAIDVLDDDPDPKPAHVLRLGRQLDYQGIIVEAEHQVGRAVGYLTKYLTKDIADTYGDPDILTPTQCAHLDRLHDHVQFLPCSSRCANWLRFGVQPRAAKAGMTPGACPAKAHDRWHLGIGGRRVLVSRQWTGKTLTDHRADRAEVVRQALEAAGIQAPDRMRMSADRTVDGSARYLWTHLDPRRDPLPDYRLLIGKCITQQQAWRAQYERAKQHAPPIVSSTGQPTSHDMRRGR